MNIQPSRRTDVELEAMLSEKGTWYVRGGPSGIINIESTLEAAVIRVAEAQAANQVVQAIIKAPNDQIVVEADQIVRLLMLFNLVDNKGRMLKQSGK